MQVRILAATGCLAIGLAGVADARLAERGFELGIADRDIEFVVSQNEESRERLSSVRYQFAEGAYAYRYAQPSRLVPRAGVQGRTPVSLRHGTVLAQGDRRAWEVDTLIPGRDGMDDVHTRSFAIRNSRYFALSSGVVLDDVGALLGDVHVYPHSTRVGGVRAGAREEHRTTADVLDYAFLSDRMGVTLREEIGRHSARDAALVELEILHDIDGTVREYRIHLHGSGLIAADSSLVTYTLDPQAGYLISRKETFDTSGQMMAQRRVHSMPLGETGLHFPSEVVEVTFQIQDSPDGPLPMPLTETRTIAGEVELLRGPESDSAFGLLAFGISSGDELMVFDGVREGHGTRMSRAVAERELSAERGRGVGPRGSDQGRPVSRSTAPSPRASGGILSRIWSFLTTLFSPASLLLR